MDKKNCSVSSKDYEVCKNGEKYGQMKGCVVEDTQGWHDNGGYVEDPNDKPSNSGSCMKGKNEKKWRHCLTIDI